MVIERQSDDQARSEEELKRLRAQRTGLSSFHQGFCDFSKRTKKKHEGGEKVVEGDFRSFKH